MAALRMLVALLMLVAISVPVRVLRWLRLLRHDPVDATGVRVLPADQPELWAMVRSAAAGVDAREPDTIRLVHDAKASMVEDFDWLGLVGGQRAFHIGVPLFQTLTRNQMLFVLGRELSHDSEGHSTLSAISRRGTVALTQVVAGLGPDTVLGRFFRAYSERYAKVLLPVRRRQEIDAGRRAAELAGPDTGVASSHAMAETLATFEEFARDYAFVAADIGLAPKDLFPGYSEFLSDPLRTPVDVEVQTALPDVDDSALLLLHDAVGVAHAVEDFLWREKSLTPVPWEDAVTQGCRHRSEKRAVQILSALAPVGFGSANLDDALSAVAHGSGPGMVRQLAAGEVADDEVHALLRDHLVALVSAAFISTGHAAYALRWDRTDALVDEAGVDLDIGSLVADLPGNAAAAQWLMGVLENEGIPRQWTPAAS